MRPVRHSSYEEFVKWYLRREHSKHGQPIPLFGSFSDQERIMAQHHSGKLQSWFGAADWMIIELDTEAELLSLVCLASEWTRSSGLIRDEYLRDQRNLKRFVRNAVECNYFGDESRPVFHPENIRKRRIYFDRLCSDRNIRFAGDDRIVLRSLSISEKASNPSGTYYLHDGLGRMLAYAYLLSRGQIETSPVEAFLAIEPAPAKG